MMKPLACLAVLSLTACVSNTPETKAAQAAQFDQSVATMQGFLEAPAKACTSLLTGGTFSVAPLKAAGFTKAKVGPGYVKRPFTSTLAKLNATQVNVGPTRKGGCAINISNIGTLYTNSNALTAALRAEGWTFDRIQNKKTRIFRRGSSALGLQGGSYSNLTSLSLNPA